MGDKVYDALRVGQWVTKIHSACEDTDHNSEADAFVPLSCGRFSPDGPDGAKVPEEVMSVEELDECRDRIRLSVQLMAEGHANDNIEKPASILVLNGATQQIPIMERWANEALTEYDLTNRIEVVALGKTPFPMTNTKTQIADLNELALTRGWQRLVIVTSDYHVARCYLYFKHISPELRQSEVIGLPWVYADRVDTQATMALLAGEIQRCMVYSAKGDLGYPWELGTDDTWPWDQCPKFI